MKQQTACFKKDEMILYCPVYEDALASSVGLSLNDNQCPVLGSRLCTRISLKI